MWERCFVWEEWDGVKGEMSWGWLHFGVRFHLSYLTCWSPNLHTDLWLLHLKPILLCF